jgi:hypothetical protein
LEINMSAQILALKPAADAQKDEVIIHVRYHPNADCAMIDECPEHLNPKQWLAHLWAAAPDYYLGLMGGRGCFRIPRDTYEAIRATA